MTRGPVSAMDFMGVGKSSRDGHGSTQTDGATLIRPTPSLPSLKDCHNWHLNLPVPEGGDRPCQLIQPRKILPEGASPESGHPPLSFRKAKGWLSLQAKEGVFAREAQSEQYAFSGTPSLEKPLEELTDVEKVHLTGKESPWYTKEKGTWCASWNQALVLQQALSVNNFFDSKNSGEKDCNKEEDASQNYSTHTTARDSFSPSQGPGSPQLGGLNSSWSACPRRFPLLPFGMDRAVSPLLSASDDRVCRPPTAQLTIFYSGVVNVYDNVPADKAQAIMLLADSGSSQKSLSDVAEVEEVPPILVVEEVPASTNLPTADQNQDLVPEKLPPMETPAVIQEVVRRAQTELPQARKASLQRFLEKRKERARARAPYAEKSFEFDGSPPFGENGSEKLPKPGKTLEACPDSTAEQPTRSLSPTIGDTHLHPACKPSFLKICLE